MSTFRVHVTRVVVVVVTRSPTIANVRVPQKSHTHSLALAPHIRSHIFCARSPNWPFGFAHAAHVQCCAVHVWCSTRIFACVREMHFTTFINNFARDGHTQQPHTRINHFSRARAHNKCAHVCVYTKSEFGQRTTQRNAKCVCVDVNVHALNQYNRECTTRVYYIGV